MYSSSRLADAEFEHRQGHSNNLKSEIFNLKSLSWSTLPTLKRIRYIASDDANRRR